MAEKILIIDLNEMSYTSEPYSYETYGSYGRGLVLELFRRFVPDEAGPYSEDNIIVIAPGLFAGNPAPSACRMLTATIEDSDKGIRICNTTGNMPQKLGSLGIAAVVIRGIAEQSGTLIHISPEGVSFDRDAGLTGCRTSEIVRSLRGRYGRDCAIIGCGIAGDMKMPLSTFFCTYPEGEPEYHSPRTGFGDVWGAKRLRALIVDTDQYFARECAEPERFRDTGRRLARAIIDDEVCGGALPAYGSITLMKILSSGSGPADLPEITAEQPVRPAGAPRLNKTCAPMCVIGCLNRHVSSDGRQYGSPSQIETQGAILRCFGVDDYDLAGEVHELATEIGIVSTEFVTACKTYAEAEEIEHGEEHLTEWLREIEAGSLIGRVIASRTHGVAGLYREFDLSEWIDRRAVQDEDLFSVKMDRPYNALANMDANELMYAQIFVLENLGFCIFTSFALLDRKETFELLAEMFEARTGSGMTGEKLIIQAHECMTLEREYHERRWKAAQRNNIPQFTKVLYRYFDSKER